MESVLDVLRLITDSKEFLLFTGLISLTTLFIWFGFIVSPHAKGLENLGRKIYEQKKDLLNDHRLFSPLRRLLGRGELHKATLFLFALILTKSMAIFLFSLTLLTPALFLFQGLSMGCLIRYYSKYHDVAPLLWITLWHLTSHIFAATPGIFMAHDWIINGMDFSETFLANQLYISFSAASALTALIASYLEAKNASDLLNQ